MALVASTKTHTQRILEWSFSFDWLGSLALNPLGFIIIGPPSAAIGEWRTMAYAAALLALASLLPLTVPAVVGLRLPNNEPAVPLENETDAAPA